MTEFEFKEQSSRAARYQAQLASLERFRQAVEDLKATEGMLQVNIGGGRTTFQTFEFRSEAEFRQGLLDLFEEKVLDIQRKMRAI